MDDQSHAWPMSPAQRRNQNACDACRDRKVKCLYDGPACRACIQLDIACTRLRPRKKRGPVNSRYAEKQRRSHSLSTSPTTSNSDFLSHLGQPVVIQKIINDWFELIHSVAPLLCRAKFLKRLEAGDAVVDREFCGLVISICAATVASLRRKSSTNYENVTVERCLEIIKENKLLERERNFSLEWCQAKYNLAASLSAEMGMDDLDGFRFMSEAVMGVKYLIYYKLPTADFCYQQLLKRLYWLIFAGLCTTEMLGRPHIGLLTSQDDINFLRPLPVADVDLDYDLQTDGWHGHRTSYIQGLNYLSDMFLIWESSQQRHNQTLSGIQEHINSIQHALDSVQPELRWRGGLSRPPGSNFGTDVQLVNLCVTQLHIRSNLLEQYSQMAQRHQDQEAISNNTITERQHIVHDLLEILYNMPREVFEANGHTLVPKIRDIGAGLLGNLDMASDDDPRAQISGKAREDLISLLQSLEKLDFIPGLSTAGEAR